MKRLFISATIGRKALVGLTGIFLALFVLGHMSGNLLLFVDAKTYNMYSHALITHPLLIPLEIILSIIFITHILWALSLSLYNFRKKGYHKDPTTSLINKTLWMQGIVILVFVVIHLWTFKFGAHYVVEYMLNGQKLEVRDLFTLVAESFQSPIYVSWYVLAIFILFFHLNHGLQASLRSLGFYSDQWTPIVQRVGLFYAILVSLGFISQPLYFFFFYKGASFGI